MADTRWDRAMEVLHALEDGAADDIIDTMREMAPDYLKASVEFAFGDVYSRTDVLDFKAREIATIATLTALGTARPQLKVHIRCGLKAGLTREQIAEVIGHVGVYAGAPSAMNGFSALKEAIKDRESKKPKQMK